MINGRKSRNVKTKNYIINVNCYTWINNSHGLFDYESENFYKKCFKIKCLYNYYYIFKDDINVEIKNEEEISKIMLNNTNLKLICKIKYINNNYQLIPCIEDINDGNDSDARGNNVNENNTTENDVDNFWVIVKYLKNKSSVLHEDDVIKLGRVKLKIKKIITNTQQEKEYNKSLSPFDDDECETVAPETEQHCIVNNNIIESNIISSNFVTGSINSNAPFRHNRMGEEHVCINCGTVSNDPDDSYNMYDDADDFVGSDSPAEGERNGSNRQQSLGVPNCIAHQESSKSDHSDEHNMGGAGSDAEGDVAGRMHDICLRKNTTAESEIHENRVNNRRGGRPTQRNNDYSSETNVHVHNAENDNNRKGTNNDMEIVTEENNAPNTNLYETVIISNESRNEDTLSNAGTDRKGIRTLGNSHSRDSLHSNLDKDKNGSRSRNEPTGEDDNPRGSDAVNNGREEILSQNGKKKDEEISVRSCHYDDALCNSVVENSHDEKNILNSAIISSHVREKNTSKLEKSTYCDKKDDATKKEENEASGEEMKNGNINRSSNKNERSGNAEGENCKDKERNTNGVEFLPTRINCENGLRSTTNRTNRYGNNNQEEEKSSSDHLLNNVVSFLKGKSRSIDEGENGNNSGTINSEKSPTAVRKRIICENIACPGKGGRGGGETPLSGTSGYGKDIFSYYRKDHHVIPSLYNCRICLCEYENDNNPLISPCKCKGSMKYVHLNCLRTWMRGRLNVRNDCSSYSFFWKQLNCELCKFPYPTYIHIQNKFLELYEIPKPELPYIIIELMNDRNKGFYIVSLANTKCVRMGRGHDSDIRVNDISVSRFHAIIKFHNGNFYIEDCKSKFGTLIQIKKPVFFNIRRNKFIALQIGRTVMYVYMKRKNWIFLPICLKLSKTKDEDVSTLDNFSSKLLMDNNMHLSNNNFQYNRNNNNELANYDNINHVIDNVDNHMLINNLDVDPIFDQNSIHDEIPINRENSYINNSVVISEERDNLDRINTYHVDEQQSDSRNGVRINCYTSSICTSNLHAGNAQMDVAQGSPNRESSNQGFHIRENGNQGCLNQESLSNGGMNEEYTHNSPNDTEIVDLNLNSNGSAQNDTANNISVSSANSLKDSSNYRSNETNNTTVGNLNGGDAENGY
ncbi:FHA domain protein, putative [Plasmodium ovale]|uniref:FHA domain protein, putative n=2 Tax=Plasmodium ovale TaxID=36330 RepID=A0A1A8VNG3_PLAOA|nr:FHA domain protein, putative [Plasmodium ovale curtisi]SBS84960.1 FHA domain protein, putative [Plasmodium ovale curtisi]SCQ16086.1 FHA domain protein, putative [Plasmodium ovale]